MRQDRDWALVYSRPSCWIPVSDLHVLLLDSLSFLVFFRYVFQPWFYIGLIPSSILPSKIDMHKKFNTDIKRLFCIKPFRCVPIYLKTSNSVAAFWCCSNVACKSFDSFNHLWDSLAFLIHSVIFFTLYPCLLGTFFSPEQHSLLSNLKTQGSGNSEFFSPILSSSRGNGILGNDSTFIRPCVIESDSWGFVWFLRLFNLFLMPHSWASWQLEHSLLWCQQLVQTSPAPAHLQEPSPWPHRLTTVKPTALFCPCSLQPFWIKLGGLPWSLWKDPSCE